MSENIMSSHYQAIFPFYFCNNAKGFADLQGYGFGLSFVFNMLGLAWDVQLYLQELKKEVY